MRQMFFPVSLFRDSDPRLVLTLGSIAGFEAGRCGSEL